MKKTFQLIAALLIVLAMATACSKESYTPGTGSGGGTVTPTPTESISDEIKNADLFAQDALDVFYLWNKEIESEISSKLNPATCKDPIAVVEEIKYKEDRWTELFDDITPFKESVEGISTTNGMSLSVGTFTDTNNYFFIVNFVYAGSPAEKAGIKRGDVIIYYNKNIINDSNLMDAYYGETSASYGLAEWTDTGIADLDKSVTLNPVKMYLDPIIINKTFDVNGKKVGYLMYDSFDIESVEKMIEVCKQFKSQGVKELILDLRYNGGGYVFTEEVMASLFAPESAVKAKSLYMKEVYNSVLTEAWSKDDPEFNLTYLSFNHEFGTKGSSDYKNVSTANANIGLEKIYAIVNSNTASASESLLVGLNPYMSIVTVGQQTHGKFCTGYILGSDDLYDMLNRPSFDKNKISKWGIYVMVSTYSDKNGNNMCRPDGIKPNIEASDEPWEGIALGNENESMLKAALTAAGKNYTTTRMLQTRPRLDVKTLPNKYKFGRRIKELPEEKLK